MYDGSSGGPDTFFPPSRTGQAPSYVRPGDPLWVDNVYVGSPTYGVTCSTYDGEVVDVVRLETSPQPCIAVVRYNKRGEKIATVPMVVFNVAHNPRLLPASLDSTEEEIALALPSRGGSMPNSRSLPSVAGGITVVVNRRYKEWVSFSLPGGEGSKPLVKFGPRSGSCTERPIFLASASREGVALNRFERCKIVWTARICGTAVIGDFAVRSDGTSVVVGSYTGTLTFEGRTLENPDSSPWIALISPEGQSLAFLEPAINLPKPVMASSLALGSGGEIFLAGDRHISSGSNSPVQEQEFYAAKLNSNFETIWVIPFSTRVLDTTDTNVWIAPSPTGAILSAHTFGPLRNRDTELTAGTGTIDLSLIAFDDHRTGPGPISWISTVCGLDPGSSRNITARGDNIYVTGTHIVLSDARSMFAARIF